MGILSKLKSLFKKTVSTTVESVSKTVGVVAVVALPALTHAEGAAPFMDPTQIKTAVDGIGMPALIGAAVVAMLAIAVLIWGGKKLIGFFGK